MISELSAAHGGFLMLFATTVVRATGTIHWSRSEILRRFVRTFSTLSVRHRADADAWRIDDIFYHVKRIARWWELMVGAIGLPSPRCLWLARPVQVRCSLCSTHRRLVPAMLSSG